MIVPTGSPTATSSTPILDRLEPLPRIRGPRVLKLGVTPIAIGVLAGLVLGFVDVRPYLGVAAGYVDLNVARIGDTGIVRFGAVVFLTLLVTVAMHEAGHAIVGVLVGFQVHSIRIWRLQIEPPFKLSIYRGPMSGAGGWAVCTPKTTDRLALRAGVMLFAGPAVNIVSGLLMYKLYRANGLFPTIFTTWSIAIGAVNLLPIRTGPLFSDGYRILMLLFDRERGERWMALLALSKDLLDGVPPESFSPEFIRVATAVKDESSDTVSAHIFAYTAAFRADRCDDAAAALETCLRYSGRTSKPFQHALMSDAVVFQGRCRRNTALAEAWLNDMPAKMAIPWHREWAEAGVLHARGEWAALLTKLDAIQSAILRRPGPYQKFSLGAVDRWRADVARIS